MGCITKKSCICEIVRKFYKRQECTGKDIIFMLYLRDGSPFEVEYNKCIDEDKSTLFKVEKIKGCCAKLRIMKYKCIYKGHCNKKYRIKVIPTREFVNVDLNCFCGLKRIKCKTKRPCL